MKYTSKAYALFNRKDTRHIEEVKEYLDLQAKDKVLEIGCARGFTLRGVQKIAPNSFGIDANPQAVAHGVASNLSVMDAAHLEFADNTFDKVYSLHTIEHVADPRKMIQEIGRVLKPGGLLFLAYPAEPIRGLFAIPSAVILRKSPRKVHRHKFSPKKIKAMLQDSLLFHAASTFSWVSFPQFFTLLQKI